MVKGGQREGKRKLVRPGQREQGERGGGRPGTCKGSHLFPTLQREVQTRVLSSLWRWRSTSRPRRPDPLGRRICLGSCESFVGLECWSTC